MKNRSDAFPNHRLEHVSVCGPDSVRTSAVIGGEIVDCLVDTGATVSILPKKFAKEPMERSSLDVRSVNGESLKILGAMNVEIFLEHHYCGIHKFLVADIQCSPILGADFLEARKMCIDLERRQLRWDGGRRYADIRTQSSERAAYVTLTEDVSLSEGHISVVLGKVVDERGRPVTDSREYATEGPSALSERTGLLVARALVDTSAGIIPVQLISLDRSI